ncbi:MAG: hypothetical protein HY717_00635 [Planctomycetes bacterium]|nr:hypothetical protein [Planctomycetota bacterium]
MGPPPPPKFLRGDVNANLKTDEFVTDAIYLLSYQFLGGPKPDCLDAADVDDDGEISAITDAIYLLVFGFLGGPRPPLPGPGTCGPDPTADKNEPEHDIGCASYPACL